MLFLLIFIHLKYAHLHISPYILYHYCDYFLYDTVGDYHVLLTSYLYSVSLTGVDTLPEKKPSASYSLLNSLCLAECMVAIFEMFERIH